MTVWDPRSFIMTAGAVRCPVGLFGALLTSGQVLSGAAEADTGGWGSSSLSSQREEDKVYKLGLPPSPHS